MTLMSDLFLKKRKWKKRNFKDHPLYGMDSLKHVNFYKYNSEVRIQKKFILFWNKHKLKMVISLEMEITVAWVKKFLLFKNPSSSSFINNKGNVFQTHFSFRSIRVRKRK